MEGREEMGERDGEGGKGRTGGRCREAAEYHPVGLWSDVPPMDFAHKHISILHKVANTSRTLHDF